MFAEELVVLDFETTGLNPDSGDRITEVAALQLRGGKIVDEFQSLVNCGVQVPPFITAFTGITQAMVDDAPPVHRVLGQLLTFIGERPIVAHNARFDQGFLARECKLAGRELSPGPFICSLLLSRRLYPDFPGHSLSQVASRLRIAYRGAAHRAGADAEVTANLLFRIGRDLLARRKGLTLDSQLLQKLTKTPVAKVDVLLERAAQGMLEAGRAPARGKRTSRQS